MSGDNHTGTSELDLRIFEEWATLQTEEVEEQVRALVAEVRRLRTELDAVEVQRDNWVIVAREHGYDAGVSR